MITFGNALQNFNMNRHGVMLRQQSNILLNELSTGKVNDVGKHLGNKRVELMQIDHRNAEISMILSNNTETNAELNVLQNSLSAVSETVGELADRVTVTEAANSPQDLIQTAKLARQSFETIANRLNFTYQGKALFSGRATDQIPFPDPQAMLDDILTAVNGISDPDVITQTIDDWFDDPAGGFVQAFQGSNTYRDVNLDGETIEISAKADDDAFRDALKGAAMLVVSGEAGIKELLPTSGKILYAADNKLTNMQSDTGFAQGRVEQIKNRLTTEQATLNNMRSDLVGIDSYSVATRLQEVQSQLEMHYTLTVRMAALSFEKFM